MLKIVFKDIFHTCDCAKVSVEILWGKPCPCFVGAYLLKIPLKSAVLSEYHLQNDFCNGSVEVVLKWWLGWAERLSWNDCWNCVLNDGFDLWDVVLKSWLDNVFEWWLFWACDEKLVEWCFWTLFISLLWNDHEHVAGGDRGLTGWEDARPSNPGYIGQLPAIDSWLKISPNQGCLDSLWYNYCGAVWTILFYL